MTNSARQTLYLPPNSLHTVVCYFPIIPHIITNHNTEMLLERRGVGVGTGRGRQICFREVEGGRKDINTASIHIVVQTSKP